MAKETNVTRGFLLAAPPRDWKKTSSYENLYIIPSKKKHDSGWMLMTIVGMDREGKAEVAAYCDDICWKVSQTGYHAFRTDCTYPSGILHLWGALFTVGMSLSSTDITVTTI